MENVGWDDRMESFLKYTQRHDQEKLLISDGKEASDSARLILTLSFRKEYLQNNKKSN